MQLAKYRPQRNLSERTNNSLNLFDGLWDDFFTPAIATVTQKAFNEELKVDIYEKDDAVFIDAELPGVEKDDIFVDAKGKLVTLGGERRSDEEIKEENSYRRERRYGRFERTFNLPFEVDVETVKATFTNGILKLEIPKPAEAKPKKITIQ
jgi:HSP20 family protein